MFNCGFSCFIAMMHINEESSQERRKHVSSWLLDGFDQMCH